MFTIQMEQYSERHNLCVKKSGSCLRSVDGSWKCFLIRCMMWWLTLAVGSATCVHSEIRVQTHNQLCLCRSVWIWAYNTAGQVCDKILIYARMGPSYFFLLSVNFYHVNLLQFKILPNNRLGYFCSLASSEIYHRTEITHLFATASMSTDVSVSFGFA